MNDRLAGMFKARATYTAVFLFLCSSLLLFPLLSRGLPYLHLEDETHHINRTLEMAKSGDLNPHYFHKPSLHFYVRLPFANLGITLEKKNGQLKNGKDIRTRDPYGLAGYAFTASHPGLVEWIRLPSLLLSAGTVALAGLFVAKLGGGMIPQLAAGLLVLLSPEFLKNSTLVGVDILMTFFCLLASYFSVRLSDEYTKKNLLLAAIFSGLAVSSKYNAAPIIFAPIAAVLLCKKSLLDIAILGIVSLLSFLAASPYIVLEFPLFLQQLTYEGWHYAVAGHVGHEAKPGIEQASFYLSWIVRDGIGYGAWILGIAGMLFLISGKKRESLVFLSFPVIYILMMIFQKANFTRNMVVVIPFVAILAAVALSKIRKPSVLSFLAALSLIQPACSSYSLYFPARTESRRDLEKIITEASSQKKDAAISGELLMPIGLFGLPGVDAFDPEKTPAQELFLKGYDLIAFRKIEVPDLFRDAKPKYAISGDDSDQRIPQNPGIAVYEFRPEFLRDIAVPRISLKSDYSGESEGHLWLKSRKTFASIPGLYKAARITLLAMSPWPHQEITLAGTTRRFQNTGVFEMLEFPVASDDTSELEILLSQVHSPAALGVSQDTRRLGVAIKRIDIVQ